MLKLEINSEEKSETEFKKIVKFHVELSTLISLEALGRQSTLCAAAKARARIASFPLARLGNICARGVFFITKEHLLFEPRPGCSQVQTQ